MRGEDGGLHRPPSEVVSQLIAAVSDGRIEDLHALVDPEVRCIPVSRPL